MVVFVELTILMYMVTSRITLDPAIYYRLAIGNSAAVLVLELKIQLFLVFIRTVINNILKQRIQKQYLVLRLVPNLLVPRPGKTNRIS